MNRQNYMLLTIGLLSILAFSIVVIPVDALKSEGTPAPTINSKQVCGDSLCPYPMSISEKIDMFFANSMESDDTMVFQQSIPSTVSPGTMVDASYTLNANFDNSEFMKISKILSMKNKGFGTDTIKSKQLSSFSIQKISKISDMTKQLNIKSKMDFSKTKLNVSSLGAQKAMKLSEIKKLTDLKPSVSKLSKEIVSTLKFDKTSAHNLGKMSMSNLDKIQKFDAKNLKSQLKDLPGKDFTQKPIDSKYSEMIEKLKEQKIKIKKSD